MIHAPILDFVIAGLMPLILLIHYSWETVLVAFLSLLNQDYVFASVTDAFAPTDRGTLPAMPAVAPSGWSP
jgi:hypothetical protein